MEPLLAASPDDSGDPAPKPDCELEPPPPGYVRRRRIFVGVSMLGTTCVYLLRSNVGVLVIPMAAQFGWDKGVQGEILSAYFFGYVAAQLPGAALAMTIGGRATFLAAAVSASMLSALAPAVAARDPTCFIALRALTGLVEGGAYPAMHGLIAAWARPDERSTAAAWIYSGNYAGTALGLGLTGLQLAFAPWQSVFYAHAGACLAWSLLFSLTVFDSPAQHPSIAAAEVRELDSVRPPPLRPSLRALRSVPLRRMLANPAFVVVVFEHFCCNFSAYVLSSWIPTFLKEQLHEPTDSAGLLAVLPYVAAWSVSLLGGVAADRLIAAGTLSVTATRKIWQCSSLAVTALLLAGVGYATSAPLVLAMLVVAVGASGLTESGYHCNHIDLFPQYASAAFSCTNLVGNLGGVVGPWLVGSLLASAPQTPAGTPAATAWPTVFLITAGVNVFGAVIWAAFASGEKQQVGD
jgi:sugar phosphate permease